MQHPYTFQAVGQLRPWLHIKLGAARGLRKQHGLQHARHAHMCDSRSAACNNRTAQQHPLSGWRSSPCHASPPRAACPSCRLNSLLQWKAYPIVQPQPCGTCPPNDVRLALGVDMVCEPAVRSDAADRRSGPQNICTAGALARSWSAGGKSTSRRVRRHRRGRWRQAVLAARRSSRRILQRKWAANERGRGQGGWLLGSPAGWQR